VLGTMTTQSQTSHTPPDEPRLTVIIPCFNEELRLGSHLREVKSYLDAHLPGSEILVIDDGSKDKTRQVAEEILGPGSVISQPPSAPESRLRADVSFSSLMPMVRRRFKKSRNCCRMLSRIAMSQLVRAQPAKLDSLRFQVQANRARKSGWTPLNFIGTRTRCESGWGAFMRTLCS